MPFDLRYTSAKQRKDARSADSERYRRDRGRRDAQCDRAPEADMYQEVER
jgi:hypothetical protein